MRFRLSIYERSYLDDHSNGKKIYDTFESSLLYEKIFRKIQAALRHFYEEFEGSRRGIFKINDGINIMFRISFIFSCLRPSRPRIARVSQHHCLDSHKIMSLTKILCEESME